MPLTTWRSGAKVEGIQVMRVEGGVISKTPRVGQPGRLGNLAASKINIHSMLFTTALLCAWGSGPYARPFSLPLPFWKQGGHIKNKGCASLDGGVWINTNSIVHAPCAYYMLRGKLINWDHESKFVWGPFFWMWGELPIFEDGFPEC